MAAEKINVPIIWVLGGPGSGKGTMCEKMVEKYGLVHLSSGDLLRNEAVWLNEYIPTPISHHVLKHSNCELLFYYTERGVRAAEADLIESLVEIVLNTSHTQPLEKEAPKVKVSSGSKRGKELSAVMERGELVDRQVVLDLLKEAIHKSLSTAKGFLIDGYPREKEQGKLFEEQIGAVTIVLYIDAVDETLVKRLVGRSATSGRADDNEETIKKRLHTFHTHNNEVIAAFASKMKKIDSEPAPAEVFKQIETYLDPIFK